MTLCELMSELEKHKDKKPFYSNAVLKVAENDGVWIGEFKIDSVEYNENKHSIELCCEGKRTNFLHSSEKKEN